MLQNEIPEEDTELLIRHGCKYVVEGANMPSTNEAIHMYNQVGGWKGVCGWQLDR